MCRCVAATVTHFSECFMQKIPLGSSNLCVTKLCLGTMTFGEQNSEAEAHSQLDYAIERGINFIDTAEIYPVMPRSGHIAFILPNFARGRPRPGAIGMYEFLGAGRWADHSKRGTAFFRVRWRP